MNQEQTSTVNSPEEEVEKPSDLSRAIDIFNKIAREELSEKLAQISQGMKLILTLRDGKKLEITLAIEDKSTAYCFKVTANRDDKANAVSFDIRLMIKPHPQDGLQFDFGGRYSDRGAYLSQLFDVNASEENGDSNESREKFFDFAVSEKDFLVNMESKRRPNGYIQEIWFGRASSPRDDRVHFERAGIPHWPTYTPDGSLKVKVPQTRIIIPGTTEGEGKVETDWEAWASLLIGAGFLYLTGNLYGARGLLRDESSLKDEVALFPSRADYQPERPVDLKPSTVQRELANQHDGPLHIPWHVVEAACAALNMGKHVIFTGPPGCGKSKLSIVLAKLATAQAPVVATASEAWTSGDLVGRYLPDVRGGGRLAFKPGLFLRAAERNRWLIIDEFNRANIDACFGELFSVLANDSVELPFEQALEIDDAQESGTKTYAPVRILPPGFEEELETESQQYRDYHVPEKMRIVGSMNDADRSGLNELSFALQRRFAIIPLEAPRPKVVQTIIENGIDAAAKRLGKFAWQIGERKNNPKASVRMVQEELIAMCTYKEGTSKIFIPAEKREGKGNESLDQNLPDDDFKSLVAEKVIGVSVVLDLIAFVGEGLRTGSDNTVADHAAIKKLRYQNDLLPIIAEDLALSYLALGIVLMVFPQLEALAFTAHDLENGKLIHAVRRIFWSFNVSRNAPHMLRIEGDDDGYNLSTDKTIDEFLLDELKVRFPGYAARFEQELAGVRN